MKASLIAFIGLFSFHSWGQIVQRGIATTNSVANTNGTTLVINKPEGIATGDVLLLSIVQNETDNDNGGLTSPTLSGWTIVKDGTIRSDGTGNNDNLWFGSVYYRIANGSEGSSFSLTMHSRCDMAIGSIVAFSGVATNALKPDGTTGGPFDVVPSSLNNSNSTTATATGLTVLTNNSAVVMIAMVNNDIDYSNWSNGQTQLFGNKTSNGDDASVGAAWNSCVTSGATGNGTVTISGTDRNSALYLVLRRATALSVGAASSTPTLCMNTSLTNITHTTTGATGIGTPTGLPAGVSASWSSNTITISGTPTASGTFNYSIPVNSGCVNATGTITVLPSPTVVSASSSASTICAGGSVNLTSSATSNSNTTTTLLNQNFNSTPTGWTTTNTSTGGTTGNAAWSLRANGYSYTYGSDPAVIFNSNDNSQFYLTNSASQGSANTKTTLQSPAFSTVGLSAASLSFYQYFRAYSGTSAIVEISTNGTSWTSLAIYTTDKGNVSPFVEETINLSSYLNQASVSIRFRYDGGWGWYWAVDNVSITGTLSTPPSASFAWTSSPGSFTSSTQNPTGVSPSATTTYTVTATNNYGCTASASTTVTVNSLPAVPTIAVTAPTCSSAATNILSTYSASLTYTSTPSGLSVGAGGVITGGTNGTSYTIRATNASSCFATSASFTFNGGAMLSTPALTVSPNQSICTGSAATLTVSGAQSYLWSNSLGAVSSVSVTPGSTTTYTVTGTAANGCTNTASTTVTITQPTTAITIDGVTIGDGDYLWNGRLNSNANVKNNWYVLNNGVYSVAAQVPQSSDEVFVVSAENAISCVSNSNNLTIPVAGNFNSSNLNIGENASVSLGNGSSCNVKGDFINDGNFNAGSGTVVMNGTSLQKIKGSAANTTFKNLTIDNSNGVKIEKDVVIDSVLSLTNGLIDLASNHLTIGALASIHGTPASSKMIVASGTGELRKQFSPGTYNPASFTFPVGTSNGTNKYNPVVLDFASATFGSTAYVSVRVQDQKNSMLHNDHSTYINKNWIVEPNNDVSNFNYNIKLYFNPATLAQGGDFVSTSGQTIGDLIPVKYSGGQWYQPIDGTFSNALTQGTAGAIITNYLTWDGLTTFSEFGGVGGSNNPLPVELLSFNGTCEEGMVNLVWQTASEFNSSHFDVEKSTDGETWRVMATIPSAGTSNELLTYQAVDNNGTNGSNYYRLRQVDNDGKEKLYDPINVSCVATTAGYFTSYPNPSGNEFQVLVNNKEILGACTLNIVDAQGKVIDQRSIEVKDGINMFVISEKLNPGIYFLNITNGTKTTQVIKHAVK